MSALYLLCMSNDVLSLLGLRLSFQIIVSVKLFGSVC